MAHGPMTLGAASLIFNNIPMCCNVPRHTRMALDAIVLQVIQICLGDPDGLGIILQRECFRMIPAIPTFDDEFLRDRMRHMTVIARGRTVMTTPLP